MTTTAARIFGLSLGIFLASGCGGAASNAWPHGTTAERCVDQYRAAQATSEAPGADNIPASEHLALARSANARMACDASMDAESFMLSDTFLTARSECLSECLAAASSTSVSLDELTSAQSLWRRCVSLDRTCESDHVIDVGQGDEALDTEITTLREGVMEGDGTEAFRSGEVVFMSAYRRLYENAQSVAERQTMLKHLIAFTRRANDDVGSLLYSMELVRIATTPENERFGATHAQFQALLIVRNSLAVSTNPDPDYDICNSLHDETIDELKRILDCEHRADAASATSVCAELSRARLESHRYP
ncbi:MAG: hypothetical protein IPK60_18510 [Sandaracinaceae bacterium]|jgi:hypothetical protein|nr:hypothetical protein [Sandaracinaceae bacterium]